MIKVIDGWINCVVFYLSIFEQDTKKQALWTLERTKGTRFLNALTSKIKTYLLVISDQNQLLCLLRMEMKVILNALILFTFLVDISEQSGCRLDGSPGGGCFVNRPSDNHCTGTLTIYHLGPHLHSHSFR